MWVKPLKKKVYLIKHLLDTSEELISCQIKKLLLWLTACYVTAAFETCPVTSGEFSDWHHKILRKTMNWYVSHLTVNTPFILITLKLLGLNLSKEFDLSDNIYSRITAMIVKYHDLFSPAVIYGWIDSGQRRAVNELQQNLGRAWPGLYKLHLQANPAQTRLKASASLVAAIRLSE